jgi:hypothetical protein
VGPGADPDRCEKSRPNGIRSPDLPARSESLYRLRYSVSGGILVLYIIIDIQPLGRSGQRPELSQATGMALVRCILGKFLGVVCHCFPPVVCVYVCIYITRLASNEIFSPSNKIRVHREVGRAKDLSAPQ